MTHIDPFDRADRQSYEILKIQDGCGRLLKNRNNASFYTSLPLNTFYCTVPNKAENVIKQNWNQFVLVIKATALEQQISKFYPQILSTEASFYIYDMSLTDTNVIASVCALNLRIKVWHLLF